MAQSTAEQALLTVTATSRPKRIAVLFDPDKGTPEQTDAIVEHSMQCWGGGYYPIVATDGSFISDDGWRLLRAVDPDVVLVVPEVKEELLVAVERAIGPASIHVLNERERSDPYLWFSATELSSLGVDEIPRLLAAAQPWGIQHRYLCIRDGMGDDAVRSFARRNFGLVRETVSTKRAFEGLTVETIRVEEADVAGLLNSFTKFVGSTTTTRDLGRAFATRPYDLKYDTLAGAFHVVIGDSARDLIFAWNRQLVAEDSVGREFLWVPASLADDKALVTLVGKWIAHAYWNSQNRRGHIVSYSVDGASLSNLAAEVSEAAGFHFSASFLAADRFPFPDAQSAWPRQGLFQEPPLRLTERIAVGGGKGLMPFPPPRFVANRRAPQGNWMVDLDIEYHLDPPRFSNQADVWRLPKRREFGRDFVESSGLARIVSGGMPSVEVGQEQQSIELRIPGKRTILYRLLGSPNDTPVPHRSKARFEDYRTSLAGHRLQGIIGLFGSLYQAGAAFDDEYWRNIFAELAGATDRQSKALVGRVEPLLGQAGSTDGIDTPEKRARLARRIVSRVQYYTRPIDSMSYHTLRMRAREVGRIEHVDQKGRAKREPFDDFKVQQLEDFLELGILLQGVLLRCDHCQREDWWVTDRLARTLQCNGCLRQFPIPPSPTWEFRLNSLISDGIRKEGVQAVLHALFEKSQLARDFFFFVPCQDIREERGGTPFTDLDIVAISDGRVIVGEAKSRPDSFLEVDFDKLRAIGEAIRPDVLLLAATGTNWPEDVSEQFEVLRKSMEPLGTRVEPLLLPW